MPRLHGGLGIVQPRPTPRLPLRLEPERLRIQNERSGDPFFGNAPCSTRPRGCYPGGSQAERADGGAGDDVITAIGLNAPFDDLAIPQLHRQCQTGDHVQVQVPFGDRSALTVVHAEGEDAEVARPFQAAADEGGKQLLIFFRRPVVEDAEIAFVGRHRGVDRIGAVEWHAVRTRLHIFKAVRNLRQTDPKTVDFGGIQIQIGVKIS